MVARGGGRGVGEMGKGGQKIQTSSYKTNKSWGCNVRHGDDCQQYCVVYLKISKKVDLKSSHCKKKNL